MIRLSDRNAWLAQQTLVRRLGSLVETLVSGCKDADGKQVADPEACRKSYYDTIRLLFFGGQGVVNPYLRGSGHYLAFNHQGAWLCDIDVEEKKVLFLDPMEPDQELDELLSGDFHFYGPVPFPLHPLGESPRQAPGA